MSTDGSDTATGIGVIGLDHVQLAMPPRSERAARSFYAGTLGLREVDKPAALVGRGGCWFVGPGGTAIHLGVDERFMAAKKGHPCLIVADLAAARLALREAGVPIENDADTDLERCYVSDPFGNRIELVDVGDAGFTDRPPPG